MIKYTCNICGEKYDKYQRRNNGFKLMHDVYYCASCYNKVFGEIVKELLAVKGLQPLIKTEDDECEFCGGTGDINHYTTHQWTETCLACDGTGKILRNGRNIQETTSDNRSDKVERTKL